MPPIKKSKADTMVMLWGRIANGNKLALSKCLARLVFLRQNFKKERRCKKNIILGDGMFKAWMLRNHRSLHYFLTYLVSVFKLL